MNKEPLTLKYRPKLFKDLVGQEIVSRFCTSLVKTGNSRNLIFSGSFGSGKTTSARIYAKALLCEHPTEDGEPCQECESCRLFENHNHPDYHEFDAASAGSKENINKLLELMKTKPIKSKYRVLVLDESHSLSNAACDALLKSLEEPLPFQVFLFSTTEVNKMRPALRSRCSVLTVTTLSEQDSVKHLSKICNLEDIKFDERALEAIHYKSEGHPRDLLKNLEQVYLTEGDVCLDSVKRVFDLDYLSGLTKFVYHFINNELSAGIEALETIKYSPDKVNSLLIKFLYFLKHKICYGKDVLVDFAFKSLTADDLTDIVESLNKLDRPKADLFNDAIKYLSSLNPYDFITYSISIEFLYTLVHGAKGDVNNLNKLDEATLLYNKVEQIVEGSESVSKRKLFDKAREAADFDTTTSVTLDNLNMMFIAEDSDGK